MSQIYSTKSYARSEIGRALSECSQFAHVRIAQIFEYLDENKHILASKIPIVDEIDCFAFAFSGGICLRDFTAQFGTLCPLCLCPVMQPKEYTELWEFKADKHRNKPFLPEWLTIHNHDVFQPVHDDCKPFAAALECIGGKDIIRQRNGMAMVTSKRFLVNYANMVTKKDRPHLRFNPRHPRHIGPEYYQPIRTWGTEWRDGDIVFSKSQS